MPNLHPEAFTDPFAYPFASTIAVTHTGASHQWVFVYSSNERKLNLIPSYSPDISAQHHQIPVETHDDAHGAIIMPLPAFHGSRPIKVWRNLIIINRGQM